MPSSLFPVPRRTITVLLGCSLAATSGLSACSSRTRSPSTTTTTTVGTASSASNSPAAQAPAGLLQQLEQVARRLAGDFEAGHMDTTMAMAGPQARAAGLSATVLSTARDQIDTQAVPFQSIIGTFATAEEIARAKTTPTSGSSIGPTGPRNNLGSMMVWPCPTCMV